MVKKSQLLGLGVVREGQVIINPFGTFSELDEEFEKTYKISELEENKEQILMYPKYDEILSNLEFIRKINPIIYLSSEQKKEIEFLSCFFEIKRVKFSKKWFLEFVNYPGDENDKNEFIRLANKNNYIKAVFVYLTLFEKYNLLLNPNMFKKDDFYYNHLFKDYNLIEQISEIEDFKILKKLLNNLDKYELSSNYILDLLFVICSEESSEFREALVEISNTIPPQKINSNYAPEMIKQLMNCGYVRKENNNILVNIYV